MAELAKSGFRVEGAAPQGNDVVSFEPLAAALPVGDDAARAAVAAAVAPGATATTTVVLNEGITGEDGGRSRLSNVTTALRDRINALPPGAAVGLWTFNKIDSGSVVPTGPLADPVGPQPRVAALTGVLEATTPTSGGGLSFTTLRAAYADALANYRPGQPNSVLLITQGPHTDQSIDGAGLRTSSGARSTRSGRWSSTSSASVAIRTGRPGRPSRGSPVAAIRRSRRRTPPNWPRRSPG